MGLKVKLSNCMNSSLQLFSPQAVGKLLVMLSVLVVECLLVLECSASNPRVESFESLGVLLLKLKILIG